MIHVLVALLLFQAARGGCEGVTGPTIVERHEGALVREYRPAWRCALDAAGNVVLSA